MKDKFRFLSIISLVFSLFIFAFNYYMFHYLTDSGFSAVWHAEACKPFVTELVGIFGVLFFFTGILSLIISCIFFSDK